MGHLGSLAGCITHQLLEHRSVLLHPLHSLVRGTLEVLLKLFYESLLGPALAQFLQRCPIRSNVFPQGARIPCIDNCPHAAPRGRLLPSELAARPGQPLSILLDGQRPDVHAPNRLGGLRAGAAARDRPLPQDEAPLQYRVPRRSLKAGDLGRLRPCVAIVLALRFQTVGGCGAQEPDELILHPLGHEESDNVGLATSGGPCLLLQQVELDPEPGGAHESSRRCRVGRTRRRPSARPPSATGAQLSLETRRRPLTDAHIR